MKTFLFWIIGLVLAGVVALSPEALMYFVYHLIQPQSDLARVILLAIFWLGGAGLCMATAFFGIAIFAAVTQAAIEDGSAYRRKR